MAPHHADDTDVGGPDLGDRPAAPEERTAAHGALHLQDIFAPLLLAQSCLTEQIEKYDRQLLAVAKDDQTVRRMITVPGIDPLTALSFVITIDDPTRFRHYADVGAYLSLIPRRHQSGEIDRMGRISKRGDHQVRTYLFEAANVLLTVAR